MVSPKTAVDTDRNQINPKMEEFNEAIGKWETGLIMPIGRRRARVSLNSKRTGPGTLRLLYAASRPANLRLY